MTFPETERVIYKNNPLKLVICQLRFPVDLRIDIDTPAKFQQQICREFPHAEEDAHGSDFLDSEALPGKLPQELIDSLSTRINRRFLFSSRDKSWTVSLTKDFVALETNDYIRWEEFSSRLELILSATLKTYRPKFFTRLGLRYQNVVDRNSLGLYDTSWKSLLKQFVLGPLSLDEYSATIHEHFGSFQTNLDDPEDTVRVQYGLVTEKLGDPSNVMFMLDHDFFTKGNTETEAGDVVHKLNTYNALNRRLFRWCIRDELHDAMVPEFGEN